MTEEISLSIIIPAYNEADRIGETLESISDYFKAGDFSYEVIVVDDGSDDSSGQAISRCAGFFRHFKSIKNVSNKGKGYSVRRGMLEARGKARLFMDADNSVRIENIGAFMDELKKGYDMVIGSIELKGALHIDENPWYRRFLGRISKILIRFFASPGIHDTQRGFKLFSEKAAEIVFSRQTIDRWGFDIELVVIAQAKGLKIKELPVLWVNKKTTSFTIFAYPATLVEFLKIKNNLFKGKYD